MNKSERLLPTTPAAIQLAELGRQVRELHEVVTSRMSALKKDADSAVADAILAGAALREAKAKLGHGNFLPWVKETCGISHDAAAKYMRVAKGWKENPEVANAPSIRAALALAVERVKTGTKEVDVPAYLTAISRTNKLVKCVEAHAIAEWPAEGRARVVEMLRPIVDQLPELREPTTSSAGVPRSRNLLGVEA